MDTGLGDEEDLFRRGWIKKPVSFRKMVGNMMWSGREASTTTNQWDVNLRH